MLLEAVEDAGNLLFFRGRWEEGGIAEPVSLDYEPIEKEWRWKRREKRWGGVNSRYCCGQVYFREKATQKKKKKKVSKYSGATDD